MYTQNTPVHIKLWHHQFWYLSLANLLLATASCMLIPILPVWMLSEGASQNQTAWTILAFGAGIVTQGFFCSFLVQRFRRHHVCQVSALLMALCLAGFYWLMKTKGDPNTLPQLWALFLVLRFIMGAAYGMAQMVLMSTLLIDTSESFQRTEANHAATWFGRFAISLGPLLALAAVRFWDPSLVMLASAVCPLAAVVLIELVSFPFRAPEECINVCSLDRFFLPQATTLFINFLLIAIALGIVLSLPLTASFYTFLMGGFLLALLSQKYVFAHAELKSEILSGLFLMTVALLLMLSQRQVEVLYIAPVLIGYGIGITGTRFLLFFIKLSDHCQRGTSQSTYLLAWEIGLAIGLSLGYGVFTQKDFQFKLSTSMSFILVAFAFYHLFTHSWYLKNKNR